jgi:hypothetical protein
MTWQGGDSHRRMMYLPPGLGGEHGVKAQDAVEVGVGYIEPPGDERKGFLGEPVAADALHGVQGGQQTALDAAETGADILNVGYLRGTQFGAFDGFDLQHGGSVARNCEKFLNSQFFNPNPSVCQVFFWKKPGRNLSFEWEGIIPGAWAPALLSGLIRIGDAGGAAPVGVGWALPTINITFQNQAKAQARTPKPPEFPKAGGASLSRPRLLETAGNRRVGSAHHSFYRRAVPVCTTVTDKTGFQPVPAQVENLCHQAFPGIEREKG